MNILSRIVDYKREEVAAARRARPFNELEAAALAADPPRGFLAALRAAQANKRTGLIAEIKKASPSKGLIRADFDVGAIARAYTQGGATCLSVLTDGPSFQGDLSYLRLARAASSLPLLRKDFMLDTYQVAEARAGGADCILVIMAMVSLDLAADLIAAAKTYNLDWLIEVHDEAELDRALRLESPLIGINNRDLATFETNLKTTLRLAPRIPVGCIIVSESGISTHADVQKLAFAGATSLLVGESLVREGDIAAATRKLLGET